MSVGKTWVSPADFAACDTSFEQNQPDTRRPPASAADADGWEVSADGMSDWAMILAFLLAMAVPFALVAWLLA